MEDYKGFDNVNDVYINTPDGVIDTDDLSITPLDVIKATAKKIGQELCHPKPNCKHCHGRGYIGRDSKTKAPIPCKCIQPNFNSLESQSVYMKTKKKSRLERRKQTRELKKKLKKGLL